jgi:hypothetical protein
VRAEGAPATLAGASLRGEAASASRRSGSAAIVMGRSRSRDDLGREAKKGAWNDPNGAWGRRKGSTAPRGRGIPRTPGLCKPSPPGAATGCPPVPARARKGPAAGTRRLAAVIGVHRDKLWERSTRCNPPYGVFGPAQEVAAQEDSQSTTHPSATPPVAHSAGLGGDTTFEPSHTGTRKAVPRPLQASLALDE